jgi:hypothetical protein
LAIQNAGEESAAVVAMHVRKLQHISDDEPLGVSVRIAYIFF